MVGLYKFHLIFGIYLLKNIFDLYTSGASEYTPVFSWVCFTRSLVLCVCFVDVFFFFFFGHCVVCFSSIYGF